MLTAFVKIDGATKRITDEGITQKEFAAELRGNGFKVIKIYSRNASWEHFTEWEFNNRKQAR
jgi:hypothetical protein